MTQENNNTGSQHNYTKQEEEELNQEEYQRGYNEGYIVAKYEPELLKQYDLSEKNSIGDPYITGIINGKSQYERESILEQIKKSKELQREREKTKSRDHER